MANGNGHGNGKRRGKAGPGRPRGKPLSEKERAARLKCAHTKRHVGRPPMRNPKPNKKKNGGRELDYSPGTIPGDWLAARRRAEELTPETINFALAMMRGEIRGCTASDRMRACEFIANRGKLPAQSSLEITDATPPKLIAPAVYRDQSGQYHEVDVTGPPTEASETAQ